MVGHMSVYELKVDGKRRPTLPAQLLAEIEVNDVEGTTLLARPLGRGRFLMETLDAAREQRRDELRAGFAGDATEDDDATAEVRRWREEDALSLHRAEPTGAGSNDAGQALLTLLGLQ
jgi:hypothetical protein